MKISKKMYNSTAFKYARDVREGKVVTGLRIKQAVERFFKFIETADKDGYYIDYEAGMMPILFAEKFLKHTKGSIAGQPFKLAPFQQFTQFNLFGWKAKKTGLRRFNTVYDKRAKKNGKSAEMAQVSLFALSFDQESSAEIYVGATKEEQAKICWNAAVDFINHPSYGSGMLQQLGFRCLQNKIIFDPLKSIMRPLGGDSKTQDGINSHVSVIDEYHAHKDDSVKENLESSSVQRSQPITYHITTAGVDIAGVCKQYEDDTCIPILEGKKQDDHLWIMIHDMDEDDNWEDPNVWQKANPLLGQGLKIEAIKKEYTKAYNQPSKVPNFQTKHLNMWVDAPEVWIPQKIRKQNEIKKFPKHAFAKAGTQAGLDLSITKDITALVFVSPADKDGKHYSKYFFFMPKQGLSDREREDRVPYTAWAKKGYITLTAGSTIDYEVVMRVIKEQYPALNCDRLLYDGWNAYDVIDKLEESGINAEKFSQGIATISWPTKQYEKKMYEGKMCYEPNPVIDWMIAGCVIHPDANDNIKVHKGKSTRRVDGVVAEIMGLGGLLQIEHNSKDGKYSKPGAEIYV